MDKKTERIGLIEQIKSLPEKFINYELGIDLIEKYPLAAKSAIDYYNSDISSEKYKIEMNKKDIQETKRESIKQAAITRWAPTLLQFISLYLLKDNLKIAGGVISLIQGAKYGFSYFRDNLMDIYQNNFFVKKQLKFIKDNKKEYYEFFNEKGNIDKWFTRQYMLGKLEDFIQQKRNLELKF